jgi:CheY-like chemotaxis protein
LNSLLILSKNLSENKKGNLDEKQIKSAAVIHKGGQDLLRLINDILDLSKVEAGKLHVEVDHVRLQSFVDSMKVQFDPIVEEKGIEFIVDMSPGLPATIDTDEQRLSQIIKNLLSNAVKFTENGSVTLAMSVAGKSNGMIKFDVKDTGIGIPESKQKEIFEAFQQADGSTSRQYGGTGLGLAISRAMADLLGGQVALTSESGKGSCFSLTIPLRLSTEKKAGCDAGAELLVKDAGNTVNHEPACFEEEMGVDVYIADDRGSIDDDTKSMLIIEDDPEFAGILMERSKESGYLCIAARTGWSGVALAKKYKPKAIILDLGLPDLDGMKVLEQLKYDLGTRHIPVHVVSGRQATLEAKRKGAIGFLEKPVDENSLNNTFSDIEGYIDSKIKKVLVVEDSEDSQLAIKTLISSDNIEFDSVYSSTEAMASIQNNKYDCVILDLTLPDFSGFEMLKRLGYKNVDIPPIIIYTGRELSEEEHAQLQRYASSIVLKGAESPDRLLDEVSLFLHSVETELPNEHKKKLSMLHKSDEVLLGKKILLVDDDMRNVFALSSVLEEYGLDVIIAANGKVSLEKLNEHDDVSLVLMDIMMPVMDGYEAMKAIRQQKKYESLPIIALTAKAMSEDRQRCIEAGATDYITKPVDSDQLLSMMKVWLFKS